MGKVGTRVVFGAAMIAALVGLLLLDHWLEGRVDRGRPMAMLGLPTAVLIAAIGIIGFLELGRLVRSAGVRLLTVSGLLGVLALGTSPYWATPPGFGEHLFLVHSERSPSAIQRPAGELDLPVMVLVSVAVAAAFLEQMIRWRKELALPHLAYTLLAVTYLGAGGALVLHIRMQWGVPALVLFLAAVKCTDIGAYFTGIAIGKHKMIPWLSPGKSWEGLVGGIVAAALVSQLVVWAFGMYVTFAWAACFGAAMAVTGQFADLCESLLKRSAEVKDSGALVPEFGGLLDIIDSPLLASPFAVLMLAMV